MAAGLVDAPPPVSEAGLARALAVREAIYRLALTAVTGDPRRPGDIDLVNKAAVGAPVTTVLTEHWAAAHRHRGRGHRHRSPAPP